MLSLLLCLGSVSAQEKVDAEEKRLYDISIDYFDGNDDQKFYQAMDEYRRYVKDKGYEYKYWNSWNNEIVYDINHDHYYLSLKKTEEMEKEMRKAEAKEYYFMIDYLMGVFYGTRDNNDLCEQHLKKSLEQTDPKKNISDQVAIYQMLANICIFGDGEKGMKWIDKAIDISEDNYQLCGSLGVKAMIAFTHNDKQTFDDCYKRLVKIKKETPDDYYPAYQDYIDMGRFAFDDEYDQALVMADSLQSESEKLAFKAVIYKRKGDLQTENETLKKLINAKERRNNEISTLTINDINNDLELFNERQERRRAELYTIIVVFICLIITILLLAYFGWTRRKHLRLMKLQNKELERARDHAREADRMKTAFIRNVSHQIRTPLNAVSGFSMILAEQVEELPKEERKDLQDRIEHNTALITNSLNHLIALSNIESVRVSDKDDPIPCNAFCEEIARDFKPSSDKVRFSYTTSLADEVTVRTNKEMLTNIVKELLINANKFTAEGRIILQSEIEGKMWKISVTDTGEGIKAGEEKKIFGQFEKIDDFSEGLGLGLTFCKSIALQLEGDVILDTNYRNGARFSVTIPKK